MGLLVPAPYMVPEKKAKKKATGTRRSSQRQVLSDSSSDDSEVDSSHEDEEEKKEASPPAGERRRGRLPQRGRPKGPRREGPFLRTVPPTPTTAKRSALEGQAPGEIISVRIPE